MHEDCPHHCQGYHSVWRGLTRTRSQRKNTVLSLLELGHPPSLFPGRPWACFWGLSTWAEPHTSCPGLPLVGGRSWNFSATVIMWASSYYMYSVMYTHIDWFCFSRELWLISPVKRKRILENLMLAMKYSSLKRLPCLLLVPWCPELVAWMHHRPETGLKKLEITKSQHWWLPHPVPRCKVQWKGVLSWLFPEPHVQTKPLCGYLFPHFALLGFFLSRTYFIFYQ